MMPLIDDRLMELIHAAGWTLLHFLWQGGALGFAFALAMTWTRRRSAQERYVIGCATLAAMAVAPVVTFAVVLRALPLHGVDQPVFGSPASVAALSPQSATVNPGLRAVVVIWALGAALCSAWLFGGWLHATRLRRLRDVGVPERCRRMVERLAAAMGVRAAVRLVESASVAAPIAIGWLAPVILLPAGLLAGLSAKQLEAIIAHELAHIRRFDYLVNLLQTLVESLLFFHPAVWWVSRQVRQEREYCCDDIAAAVCGDRVLYARALTELEALRGVSARLGLSSNGGSLMKRILRLVEHPSPSCRRSPWSALLVSGAVLASASAAFALMDPPAAAPTPAVAADAQPSEGDAASNQLHLQPFAVRTSIGMGQRLNLVIEPQTVEVDASSSGPNCLAQFVWQGAAQDGSDEVVLQDADQHRWWLRLNQAAQGPGEMPTEGLLHAARLAFPANLFEFMSWISPEAHELIKPPEERLLRASWLVHRVSVAEFRLELQPRVLVERPIQDIGLVLDIVTDVDQREGVVDLVVEERQADDMIEMEDVEVIEPIDEGEDE